MGFSDLRRSSKTGAPGRNLAGADYASAPSHAGSDHQLIADCRSLICKVGALLNDIEQAADAKSPEQEQQQLSLCDADDQAFNLMERIADTRAFTQYGVQNKHAVVKFLLSNDWYSEPTPCRDRLLLSSVLDAARHSYPAISTTHRSTGKDVTATTTVLVLANTCLAIIKELAAAFVQKDEDAERGLIDQIDLDFLILALKEKKKVVVEVMVGIRAFSVDAIHAKRVVLRRMLEAGTHDGDAHHLRIELARSYFSDLNAFFHTQEREPSSAQSSIWNTLTSKFRWLRSTIPHR